ncbi:retrotransposon protein, putative, ty1-copia subclass [Tanacetum coccineum]
MTEYTRPALYVALPVLSQGKKWVLLYRYMENSFYSAMEIGDEVGCQRNARIARASRVEIHNAIDAWIVGMLLISDVVCEYQIVRMESKNVMALPVQNINHSAFRSMFEREKLSGNNFNDWFRQLKLVLRVKKKMYVIEQPILPAPAANSAVNMLAEWNAVYDAFNEGACLMLGKQLERLGYVLPQDLSVGLILNGFTSDFAGFVGNYNMHNMGKTIGELHAMLIEYEKCLLKKAKTPQVMAIRGGKIQKANKKSLKAKGKGKANGKGKDKQVYIPKPKNPKPSANEHLAKDDTFHHCKDVGHWKTNCPVYLAELLKKKKQVGTASSSDYGILVSKNDVLYFNVIPRDGIFEIDMHNLVPNVNSIYNVSNKRAKHNLDSTYLWHCRLAHISKKRKMTRKPFSHRTERATDLLGIIHTDVCGPLRHVSRQACGIVQHLTPSNTPQHNGVSERRNRTLLDMVRSMINLTTLSLSFWDYALESATRILNMVPTKIVDKTPHELWYAEFFEKSLITQEVSGRAIDLEEIQDKDTSRSKITIEIPMEVKGFEPPQKEVIPIREASFILGIKIYRDRSKRLIGLSQSFYMDKILKRYRMDNSKRGHIPMQERLDLNKTQGASTPEEIKRMQNVPYASAAGSIMYSVGCTRPDVAFAQNITSRFQQILVNLTGLMKNILKFETDRDDIKSQTRYVCFKRRRGGLEELQFISGHGIIPTINEPIKMFCDNSAALLIANEPGVRKCAIHYHRRYHYVLECIELGEINLLKVHKDDNLAVSFTKALPKGKLTQHARSIRLRLASSFM